MLTDTQIREAANCHFRAEQSGDIDAILATVTDDVEYVVKAPRFADGSQEHQVTSSAAGVRQMWKDLYASFWPYRIEVDELVPSPTENRALVFVTVTATPIADWAGVPAGRPITWSIAAPSATSPPMGACGGRRSTPGARRSSCGACVACSTRPPEADPTEHRLTRDHAPARSPPTFLKRLAAAVIMRMIHVILSGERARMQEERLAAVQSRRVHLRSRHKRGPR